MLINASIKLSRVNYNSLRRLINTTAVVNGEKKHYDVIIAGGGLVGISMALSLGNYFNESISIN
jgi:NADH dehydrogenase FAD-containing subunit